MSLPAVFRIGVVAASLSAAAGSAARAQQPVANWAQVDRAFGRSGVRQPDGAYKISLPRSDLQVSVAGVTVRPALALGSWIAFKQIDSSQALLMGDLVLLEDEIAPVLQRLAAGGVEQTALHNHLLHESPHVMYLHVAARGPAAQLAATIRAALLLTSTPLGSAAPALSTAPFALDTGQIAHILGFQGRVNGGVYQVGVPRADPISVDGIEIPPSMGVATAINFQPTGGGKAAITGDCVLIGPEVNPVVHALQEGGVAITAIHSHMLAERPHLFFVHYWANADALELARVLRLALDRMKLR